MRPEIHLMHVRQISSILKDENGYIHCISLSFPPYSAFMVFLSFFLSFSTLNLSGFIVNGGVEQGRSNTAIQQYWNIATLWCLSAVGAADRYYCGEWKPGLSAGQTDMPYYLCKVIWSVIITLARSLASGGWGELAWLVFVYTGILFRIVLYL